MVWPISDEVEDALAWLVSSVESHIASVLAVLVVGFAAYRYFQDRRDAADRAADDRFMAAAAAIANESPRHRLAGIVMLRTFLERTQVRFHPIVFDYSVGLLRSRPKTDILSEGKEAWQHKYVPLTDEQRSIYQATIPALFGSLKLMELDEIENPDYALDATNINLDWVVVDNAQLSSIDISNSSMIYTQIRRSTSRTSNWTGVYGHGASLHHVDLSHSKMHRAKFIMGGLFDSKADGLEALGTRLDHFTIERCSLVGCDFEQVHFDGSVVDRSTLTGSSFYLSRHNESGFYRSDLSKVDFDGSKFYKDCSIVDCDLTDAILSGVVLDRVELNGSDFTNVNFMGVNSMNRAQMHNVKGVSAGTMKYLVENWGVITNLEYEDLPPQTILVPVEEQ